MFWLWRKFYFPHKDSYSIFGSLSGRQSWRKTKNFPLNCYLVGRKNKSVENAIENLRRKWIILFPHIFYHMQKKSLKVRGKYLAITTLSRQIKNSNYFSIFSHGYNRNIRDNKLSLYLSHKNTPKVIFHHVLTPIFSVIQIKKIIRDCFFLREKEFFNLSSTFPTK